MATKARDRVKETTTTTGTGNITLAGAVLGFRTVISALNVGDSHDFCIDSGGAEWEVSRCTVVSSTVISRDTVKASSNAGSLVNFGAGTKNVFLMPSAINGLTNESLEVMAANTVKANVNGTAVAPQDVTKASFITWLGLVTGDISGLATVATSGAYSDLTGKPVLVAVSTSGSASDLTSGTLPAARLPTPTSTSLGGVLASTGTANYFMTGISTAGAPTFGTAAGGAVIATTAPSSPGTGNLWWKSDEGVMKIYYNDGTTSQWVDAAAGAAAQSIEHDVRLYSTSGVPVPTSDTTTVSTIYVGPFNGNRLTVLNASDVPVTYPLSEISLALSGLTSGKPYDVFVYWTGSAFAIELSAAWTNDTTRSDAVATVAGLVVKSSDHTRLHVGTIYTTGTTSTADTAAKRYVWNRFNRQQSVMSAVEATASWTYSTTTFRQANAAAANQLDYVSGDAAGMVQATAYSVASANTGGIDTGIGVDSTSANSAQTHGSVATTGAYTPAVATYLGKPGIGRHFLAWLEKGAASGTTTWYGTASGNGPQTGITGTIWN